MSWRRLLALLLLLTVAITSCAGSADEPPIDLSQPPVANSVPSTHPPNREAIVFAVAAVNSPLSTFPLYDDMVSYLGDRLNIPARLAGSRTYAEINSLVRSGDATLAMVCSAAYVYGHDEFAMEPLVVPVVEGKTIYYSYLIVGTESPITDWQGLRGHTFAFTDPMSNSGRLVPLYELWKMGETPDSLFQRYIFTYSHDSSIKAVARGLVDAAAVDSLVYDYVVSQHEVMVDSTRVIWRSPPYGINPIVVNPNLDPTLKEALKQELLSMDRSQRGRDILLRLGFERFVPAEDSSYDSIRLIMESVGIKSAP